MNEKTETRWGTTATVTGTRTRGATVTRYATERTGLAASVDASRRGIGIVASAITRAWTWSRETISPAGWLLLAVVTVGMFSAMAWGWAEGLVAAVAATALLTLAVPFLLGRQSFSVRLDFDRDRVVAGTEVAASLDVTNIGHRPTLPVLLDIPVGDGIVETHVPLLRTRATFSERLTISAARRGILTVGPITIGRGDPLGILRRDHTWPGVQTIYVHPVTVPMPSASAGVMRDLEGSVTTTVVDADLSFHAIRDYLPGDSQRHVHWKSTAKTGQLMVRQYEETRRSRIAVVLDTDRSSYANEDQFEMAVSAASSLALQALREGREVVITASAHIPAHAKGTMHAIRTLPTVSARAMLDAMSGVDASLEVMSIEQVAAMTQRESRQLSLVFVVTGSDVSIARVRRAAMGFAADVKVTAVRCIALEEPTVRQVREARIITIGALHDLAHLLVRAAV